MAGPRRFGAFSRRRRTCTSPCPVASWAVSAPPLCITRPIVDCAPPLGSGALDALVDAALGRDLTTYSRIQASWKRAGRVRAGRVLDSAISPFSSDIRLGSEKEARALRRFHEWGLPV